MDDATVKVDLCFVVDSTASMGPFLEAIQHSMPECCQISRISDIIDKIGVLAYTDYGEDKVTDWSGWHSSLKDLKPFIDALEDTGGGDTPEAAKTAAFELLRHLGGTSGSSGTTSKQTSKQKTIVVWYADAPPHTDPVHSSSWRLQEEQQALGEYFDWVRLCEALAEAGVMVFPMIPADAVKTTDVFFAFMARVTRGRCLLLQHTSAKAIGTNTLSLILSLVGQPSNFDHAEVLHLAAAKNISHESTLMSSAGQGLLGLRRRPAVSSLIAPLAGDVTSLFNRFETDEGYRSRVYDVFDSILEPDYIKSVTYNPLFGNFWRAICKDRTSHLSDRRGRLLDKLSTTISTLTEAADKAEMKAFIDQSYDQSETIVRIITSCEQQFPAVMLDIPARMTTREILEISRSCHPEVLARLGTLITGLQISINAAPHTAREARQGTAAPPQAHDAAYLPLALPDKEFFACLPHLIAPGIMLSLRGSAVLAMVVVRTGAQLLQGKAVSFLTSIRGLWIDASVPENFSYEFVKLAVQVDTIMGGTLLTADEAARYKLLHVLGGLKANEQTTLQAQRPFTSDKTYRPDRKYPCTQCGQPRSFTLLDRRDVCGLCYYDIHLPAANADSSYWCQCKACAVHYAVERVARLQHSPKCHFCRLGSGPAPQVQCCRCSNCFVSCGTAEPTGRQAVGWVCPPCAAADGMDGVEDELVDVFLRDYLAVDNSGFLGFKLAEVDRFFRLKSMWTVHNEIGSLLVEPGSGSARDGKFRAAGGGGSRSGSPLAAGDAEVRLGLKPVRNVVQLRQTVLGWIQQGISSIMGTCMLCFQDFSKRRLSWVCGHRRCTTVACHGCLSSWYGEPKPGCNIIMCHLLCPFCKLTPTARVLKHYNKPACRFKVGNLDPGWHYAWCVECDVVKPHVARVCAGPDVPAVRRFRCEDCVTKQEEEERQRKAEEMAEKKAEQARKTPLCVVFVTSKPCPYCRVMVEKTGGCDHITCQCGMDWCYACGGGFTRECRLGVCEPTFAHSTVRYGMVED